MVGEVPGPGYEESKGETMGHLMIAASGGGVFALVILYVALYFIFTLGVYGTYKKAGPNGDPAWSAFVPIYNFIMPKVAGRPTWHFFRTTSPDQDLTTVDHRWSVFDLRGQFADWTDEH
jgi:hypothetical protein